jgi:hypothetical protein
MSLVPTTTWLNILFPPHQYHNDATAAAHELSTIP